MSELWVIEYNEQKLLNDGWKPTTEAFKSEKFAKEVARRENNSWRNRFRDLVRGIMTEYRAMKYAPETFETAANKEILKSIPMIFKLLNNKSFVGEANKAGYQFNVKEIFKAFEDAAGWKRGGSEFIHHIQKVENNGK